MGKYPTLTVNSYIESGVSTGVIFTMMVKECMQTEIVYVSVPGTREDVLQIMAEQQINVLPVVKKGSKALVGIVTRKDLLQKADENQLALLMMRDPETVTPRTAVKTAAKLMLEKGYRRLPVIEKDELVGLVTILDILGAIFTSDAKLRDTSIRDYISKQVIAVWQETPLPLTYMIMDMAKKNALVVINEGGGVAGMISVSDLIRLSEVSVEDNISKTYSGTDSAIEWGWTSKDFLVVTKKLLQLPNVPVKEVMTKNLINVSEVTTLSECVEILRKNDIDQAPVLSATNNLIGMIEDKQLLRIIAEIN